MSNNYTNSSTLLSNANNSSNGDISAYEERRDLIVLFLYLNTAIFAIFGNIFVCLVIYFKPNLRSTTYMLVLNMAISDIIGGLVIPAQWLFCSTYLLDNGVIGQRICGISKSSQILSYYVSTFTMTAIAIDRYRLVCKPLSTRMRPLIPILVIWALGCLFTSTTFFSMRVSEYFSPKQGIIGCRVIFASTVSLKLRTMRVMLVIITQYIIPLSLTGFFYGMVVYTVWQRERVGTVSDDKKKSFNKNKKRTIKMLIVVTVLFGLAWFPTHLMHYLKFFTKVIPITKGTCNASTFYMLCYWLGISSCSYNPFIYYYFNKDFKSEAIRYWNCIIPCLKIDTKSTSNKSEESSGTNATASTDQASTNV